MPYSFRKPSPPAVLRQKSYFSCLCPSETDTLPTLSCTHTHARDSSFLPVAVVQLKCFIFTFYCHCYYFCKTLLPAPGHWQDPAFPPSFPPSLSIAGTGLRAALRNWQRCHVIVHGAAIPRVTLPFPYYTSHPRAVEVQEKLLRALLFQADADSALEQALQS